MAGTSPGAHYQFERLGYFVADTEDCGDGRLVFNRTVTLRDSWEARSRAADSGDGDSGGRATRAQASLPTQQTRPQDALRTDEERLWFRELLSFGATEATAVGLARAPELRSVFVASRREYPEGADSIASWIVNDVARLLGSDPIADLARLNPEALADLAEAVDEEDLSHRQGRRVLEALLRTGGAFEEVRQGLDLEEISDEGALGAVLEEIIAEYPDKAAAYRSGQRGLLGFFVGGVMKRTKGKADPRKASELAKSLLGSPESSPETDG